MPDLIGHLLEEKRETILLISAVSDWTCGAFGGDVGNRTLKWLENEFEAS